MRLSQVIDKGLFFAFAIIMIFCAVSCTKRESRALTVAAAIPKDEAILYLNDLKRRHPDIKVKLEYLDESQILSALERKDDNKPDVVWGASAVTLSIARDKGLLEGYAPKRLSKLDKSFYDDSDPEKPAWIGMRGYVIGFATSEHEQNKNKFKTPRTYNDLLSEDFRNSIILPDPEKCASGYIFLAGLVHKMGEEKAWDYFEKLRKNIKTFASDEAYPVRQAGRSNAAIGISLLTRCNAEKKIGAPITVSVPADPVWDIQASAIVKKNASPSSQSTDFIDWTVSPTMMKMYSRSYPAVADTETSVEISQMHPEHSFSLPDNDIRKSATEKERLLAEWRKRFGHNAEGKQ